MFNFIWKYENSVSIKCLHERKGFPVKQPSVNRDCTVLRIISTSLQLTSWNPAFSVIRHYLSRYRSGLARSYVVFITETIKPLTTYPNYVLLLFVTFAQQITVFLYRIVLFGCISEYKRWPLRSGEHIFDCSRSHSLRMERVPEVWFRYIVTCKRCLFCID